jgi:alpha-ribazole phosphatase/probable phosphoglycerate mutase
MIHNTQNSQADVSRLVLIRHELTDFVGTFCGHLNPPLSARGRARLKGLAQSLSHYQFRSVYSSDLQRAIETAESIAAVRHLPIQLRPDLRELAFGQWEGLAWEQIMARDPVVAQRWMDEYPAIAAPEGEEFDYFLTRIQQAMSAIADQARGQCAAIVTHAGVIRTVLASLTLECDTPIELSHCSHGSWWDVQRQNGRWVLHACSANLHFSLAGEPEARSAVGCTR